MVRVGHSASRSVSPERLGGGTSGYKLRVRAGNLLASDNAQYLEIVRDLNDAYGIRSAVAHGSYTPDNVMDLQTAQRLRPRRKGKKKQEHPVSTINRVNQLTSAVTSHYRKALEKVLRTDELQIAWSKRGL